MGQHTKSLVLRLGLKSENRCWYCGSDFADEWDSVHVEHQFPKSRGGTNDFDNLVLACRRCNSTKGDKDLEEYRVYAAKKEAGIPKFSGEQLDWLEVQGFEFPEIEGHVFFGEWPKGQERGEQDGED